MAGRAGTVGVVGGLVAIEAPRPECVRLGGSGGAGLAGFADGTLAANVLFLLSAAILSASVVYWGSSVSAMVQNRRR